ncbi:MAG: hypothetical protein AAFO79_06415, partial [Pseudomonadota bacterium]
NVRGVHAEVRVTHLAVPHTVGCDPNATGTGQAAFVATTSLARAEKIPRRRRFAPGALMSA